MLYRLYELTRFHQGIMSPRIQPRETTTHHANVQLTGFQIGSVHIGDFEFPASAGFYTFGYVNDSVVIKIQSRHRVVRFRFRRFLF